MKIFNLILLGDPGAGKATQAKYIVNRYPILKEFDFGAWLRARTARDAKKFKIGETMAKGILTPTNLAREKFREVIFKTPNGRGIFFNGNPKMLGEARLVRKWFRESGRENPLVIYLSIPKREMLKRLEIRAREEHRSDDELKHLTNRMKYYEKHIAPTVKFFQEVFQYKKVSGVGTREAVRKRLIRCIKSHI
jgi:adenylate kinase